MTSRIAPPPGEHPSPSLEAEEPRRQLATVRRLALVDVILLVVLVACSVADVELGVSVLGALHGGLFLTLVAVVSLGASERLWSWWFPAAIVVTGGAVGAFLGERVVSRQLAGAE